MREILKYKRTQQIFRSQNTAKQAADGRGKLSTRVFFVSILFYPEPNFNEILNLEGKVNAAAQCYRMVNLWHLKKGNIIGNFNGLSNFKP